MWIIRAALRHPYTLFVMAIVFVPMFYLTGVARYLFVPMAEAVVFALLGSFVLSRTLVPVLAKYLLKGHDTASVPGGESGSRGKSNVAVRFQQRFERGVADARRLYTQVLQLAMGRRAVFIVDDRKLAEFVARRPRTEGVAAVTESLV